MVRRRLLGLRTSGPVCHPANRWLPVGMTAQVLAQAAFTYLPAMNQLFRANSLGAEAWARLAAVKAAAVVVLAVVRWSG